MLMLSPRTAASSAAIAALLILAGCSSAVRAPDLGGIYNRSARYHDERRNPVIVIPGILGSRLKDPESGRLVWGAFVRGYADPREDEGARLVALPMAEGAPLGDLKDDVVPDGVVDRLRVEVLGLPIEQQAYLQILAALGAGGYRDQSLRAIDYGEGHFTCFQFAYDWRRDNVENAKRLHEFILEKRAYVQGEIEQRFGVKDADVKFDIIAHSMGGLVTRYYLRYGDADLPADGSQPAITWAGTKHVDRAILVGTPSAGSAHAINQLIRGIRFAAILPKYEAALLGTFPSIYQLFPRTRHGPLVAGGDPERKQDVFSPELWERMKWGLADPEQDSVLEVLLPDVPDREARRRIALDHQRKCLERARRLAAALDSPAEPPPGLKQYLIAGDSVPTLAVLSVDEATGAVEAASSAPGDGTVLRSSALMDERIGGTWTHSLVSPIRWQNVMFLFTDHLGMTKDPAFTDNVLYLLLEDPR